MLCRFPFLLNMPHFTPVSLWKRHRLGRRSDYYGLCQPWNPPSKVRWTLTVEAFKLHFRMRLLNCEMYTECAESQKEFHSEFLDRFLFKLGTQVYSTRHYWLYCHGVSAQTLRATGFPPVLCCLHCSCYTHTHPIHLLLVPSLIVTVESFKFHLLISLFGLRNTDSFIESKAVREGFLKCWGHIVFSGTFG